MPRKRQKNTTIKDIAEAARVSPTTVSLVLCGDTGSRVSRETCLKVMETARSLNYRPNHIARSLVTQQSQTIGLVITTLFRPFYAEITQDIFERAREVGFGVLTTSVLSGLEDERHAINDLIARGVDGLIICSALRQDRNIYDLVDQNIPFVLINRHVEQSPGRQVMDYIGMDNELGGFMATTHLLKLGHRKIAHLSGVLEASTGYERRQGYRAALKDWGLDCDPDLIEIGDFDRESGYRLVRRLLSRKREMTALFAASDHIAIGAIDALEESGISVPGQMAVVGFDDIEMAGLSGVGLTTISQQKSVMGRLGVDRLIEKINGEDGGLVKTVVLPPKLVIRRTCGFKSAAMETD